MSKVTVLDSRPDETAVDLAATLAIDPQNIWQYKQQGEAYIVITRDYLKYTGVVRAIKKELPPKTAVEAEDAGPFSEPQYVPRELAAAYERPDQAGKADLAALARYLEIPTRRRVTRAQLQTAVENWKEAHAP